MNYKTLLFALIATFACAKASLAKDGLPAFSAGNAALVPWAAAVPDPHAVATTTTGDLDGDPAFHSAPLLGMNFY
ncbi:MAG: hypothetical protein ABIO49_14110, partial [Dokdonella sp.]